jgi:predicted enzyme related to lactoylglutathione lyase
MAKRNEAERRDGGVDAALARHGGLSYLEIPAFDKRQSAAFYASVVGWNVEGPESDEPKFADLTGHLIGRWITGRAPSREPGLLPYIYVDDIDASLKQVTANGGEVATPKYLEGNLWVATVRDPAGNVIGLWQERSG